MTQTMDKIEGTDDRVEQIEKDILNSERCIVALITQSSLSASEGHLIAKCAFDVSEKRLERK